MSSAVSHRVRVSQALALAWLLFAGPAIAGDAIRIPHLCDHLAASVDDETRPSGVPGVYDEDIDPARAYPACAEAYEQSRHAPRYAYQLARVLEKQGDIDTARGLYLDAARGGVAAAMVWTGFDVEKFKPAEAFGWYRKAAEAGNVLGQYDLAVAYENGIGTPVNVRLAYEWYAKASEQGDGDATYNMAVLNEEGRLMPRNVAEAIRLYELAVSRDVTDAMVNLGIMFEEGDGVPKSLNRARELFRKAAELGDGNAEDALRRLGG